MADATLYSSRPEFRATLFPRGNDLEIYLDAPEIAAVAGAALEILSEIGEPCAGLIFERIDENGEATFLESAIIDMSGALEIFSDIEDESFEAFDERARIALDEAKARGEKALAAPGVQGQ